MIQIFAGEEVFKKQICKNTSGQFESKKIEQIRELVLEKILSCLFCSI
jgi:hypothetical protein